MRVHLKSLGFSTGKSLKEYVSHRLMTALSHWSDRLNGVIVRLSDKNGPKGGVDKICAIQIENTAGASLVVTGVANDYYSAVDQAVKRASRMVQRSLKRQPRTRSLSIRHLALDGQPVS